MIGANYEARPNVTVDVASQLVKSRNAGVLRTGAAALGSASALLDEVIGPALAGAGLDPGAVQLIRTPEREAARALVSLPRLIPLVILRGSGETTAALAAEGAAHGVRTLAHADGGGVLFVDAAADRERALALVERSLDRLGVCNRLNLLLVARARWDEPPARRRSRAWSPSAWRPRCRPTTTRWATSGPSTAAARPRSRSRPPRTPSTRPGSPTRRPPASRPRSSPRTRRRPRPSWPPTAARAPSGTPPRACSTASSCSPRPRPASTSTTSPARGAPSPTATCTCASTW